MVVVSSFLPLISSDTKGLNYSIKRDWSNRLKHTHTHTQNMIVCYLQQAQSQYKYKHTLKVEVKNIQWKRSAKIANVDIVISDKIDIMSKTVQRGKGYYVKIKESIQRKI